jgi:hypothetical protein
VSGRPQIGPTDYPAVILHSGEGIRLDWLKAAGEFRQMFISRTPWDSKQLRFFLLVNHEQVEFERKNPAFKSLLGSH